MAIDPNIVTLHPIRIMRGTVSLDPKNWSVNPIPYADISLKEVVLEKGKPVLTQEGRLMTQKIEETIRQLGNKQEIQDTYKGMQEQIFSVLLKHGRFRFCSRFLR